MSHDCLTVSFRTHIVTPHVAAVSLADDIADVFVSNLTRYIDGSELQYEVNPENGYWTPLSSHCSQQFIIRQTLRSGYSQVPYQWQRYPSLVPPLPPPSSNKYLEIVSSDRSLINKGTQFEEKPGTEALKKRFQTQQKQPTATTTTTRTATNQQTTQRLESKNELYSSRSTQSSLFRKARASLPPLRRSRTKYNRNCITEFVTTVTVDDSERKQSSLLTGSEVVKQWVITGATLQCISTFSIVASQSDSKVVSLSQVNEEVFVGQCFSASWSIKCVQFWNIKKPSGPFRVLEDAWLMCPLQHSRRSRVVVRFYRRPELHMYFYSIDDGSTKRLTNDTEYWFDALCEKSDGVLVGINQVRQVRWWDSETGDCVIKYDNSTFTLTTMDLVAIDDNQLFLWSQWLRNHYIIQCGRRLNELGEMKPSEWWYPLLRGYCPSPEGSQEGW